MPLFLVSYLVKCLVLRMLRRPLSSIALKPADIDQMDASISLRCRHALGTEEISSQTKSSQSSSQQAIKTQLSAEKEEIRKRVTAQEEPQPSSSNAPNSS